ncbi:MAG: hypothetical protein IT378_24945 [Sandaracinaceae bacterium]|nr:hypothetical protein [Sandaracinaceae bacterium]
MLAACAEPAPPSRPAVEPPREDEAEPEPPPEPPQLPPACERALACCRAYVRAMPEGLIVEASACAGIPEARAAPDPAARCQLLIDGWRQALEHMPDATVPAECAPDRQSPL